MGLLDRVLKRKKKEEPLEKKGVVERKKEEKTDLEIICADDPEAYEALYDTMFLDPRGISISMEEAAKNGSFRIAGGLAIFRGDVEKVKEYFGKEAELSGEN